MPKMGESVAEATIIKWVKEIGDKIHVDETIVELPATDVYCFKYDELL